MILSSGEKKILHKRSEITAKICAPLFEKTLIKYFAYHNTYAPGNTRCFCSSAGFLQEYYEESLYPRLRQTIMSIRNGARFIFLSPVGSNNNMPAYVYDKKGVKRHNALVMLGEEHLVYHRIYFILEKSSLDHIIFVGFGVGQDESDGVNICEYYMNIMPTLTRFIRYFESQICILDEFLQRDLIHLNNYVDTKTIHPVKNKINYNIDLEFPVQGKYDVVIDGRKISFTKREAECLSMRFQNYTAKEIAKTLLISPRTVETHINNIQRKTRCASQEKLREVTKFITESAELP